MELQKLKIYAEEGQAGKFSNVITVQFNPNQVSISKTGWKQSASTDSPLAADSPATLTINLFFDTTLVFVSNQGTSRPENVQNYTKKIYSLTKSRSISGVTRPPRCKLVWGTISGKDSVLLPDGYLEQVSKTLTHFLADGTPVRATLNCTFKEWYDDVKQKKIQNPIDDPVRVVKRGETLSSIAMEEYNDPSLWRLIADENRLTNPRQIQPGQTLVVPPLRIPNPHSR
jgi:LysM repeat protein